MRLWQAQADGAALLRAAGIDGASRDADRILAAVLEIEPGQLRVTDDRDLTQQEAAKFHKGIAARALHQPVAQIVGFRDFWAHRFKVTRDTLDPRPETEVLVATALEGPVRRLLDLGTGSGAIAVSIAAERPEATGLATDISPAALDVARGNAQAVGVGDRLELAVSDWFAAVDGVFDLIVSNPPYIAEAEMAALAPEVREWEPRIALTPGGDGLDGYRAIASGAVSHLTPGGRLLVEIGPSQGAAVQALFEAAGLVEVAVLPDRDGRDRVVSGRCPA